MLCQNRAAFSKQEHCARSTLIRYSNSTIIDLYGILIYGSGVGSIIARWRYPSNRPHRPDYCCHWISQTSRHLWNTSCPSILVERSGTTQPKLSLDGLLGFREEHSPGKHRFIRIAPIAQDKTTHPNPHRITQDFRDGDILNINKGMEKRTRLRSNFLGHAQTEYTRGRYTSISYLLSWFDFAVGYLSTDPGHRRWNTQQLAKTHCGSPKENPQRRNRHPEKNQIVSCYFQGKT